jgi:hypothetical protein
MCNNCNKRHCDTCLLGNASLACTYEIDECVGKANGITQAKAYECERDKVIAEGRY